MGLDTFDTRQWKIALKKCDTVIVPCVHPFKGRSAVERSWIRADPQRPLTICNWASIC